MTMPIDLVLVRHGQSEGNFVSHHANKGDAQFLTPEFSRRHHSNYRLMPLGRQQAAATGEWLTAEGLGNFDRRYVSTYIRAMETAALLGLDGPAWMLETSLREREWGEFDGLTWEERTAISQRAVKARETDTFYWIPPSGESIAQVVMRLRAGVVDTLHRECSAMRVVIVCHGEVMWAFRALLERMTVTTWSKLERSKEPGDKIFNCQVLHYTRRDPATGMVGTRLDWMRSICPSNPANDGPGWLPIDRPRFSNSGLLGLVEHVPPLFSDQNGY